MHVLYGSIHERRLLSAFNTALAAFGATLHARFIRGLPLSGLLVLPARFRRRATCDWAVSFCTSSFLVHFCVYIIAGQWEAGVQCVKWYLVCMSNNQWIREWGPHGWLQGMPHVSISLELLIDTQRLSIRNSGLLPSIARQVTVVQRVVTMDCRRSHLEPSVHCYLNSSGGVCL